MILFTASWCNPCKQLKKWLEQEGIEVDISDIDTQPKLAAKYNVRGIPALLTSEGSLIVTNENIRPYLKEKFND